MIRTDRHALPAVDALRPVDRRTLVHNRNRLLRARPDAGTRKTPDAAVRHLHMAVHAAVTADRTDRQHRFRVIVPGLRVSQILRQPPRFVRLLLHAEPHQRHQPIFQHRPVLVDTAADRFLRPRPHLHRDSIDILFQVAAEKFLNETDHQLAARPLRIVHSLPPGR